MSGQTIKIFLSSPSDVQAERDAAARVVATLNAERSDVQLDLIRWEKSYYTAASGFQDQITPSQARNAIW